MIIQYYQRFCLYYFSLRTIMRPRIRDVYSAIFINKHTEWLVILRWFCW